jgi:hypothetical protein
LDRGDSQTQQDGFMKADHRKELKSNALAHGLEQLYGKAKSGSNLLWGGLVLVLVLGVGYWWWTGSAANKASDAWATYWMHRESGATLDDVTGRLKGTTAEKAARLAHADQLYSDGYSALFTKSPKTAQKKFTDATELYEAVSKQSSDPELGLRASVGAARCQECLGELERARWFYQDAVDRFGKQLRAESGTPHPLVAEAQKRIEALASAEALAVYGANGPADKRWPQRFSNVEHQPAKTPTTPSSDQRPSPLGGP